MLAETFDQSWIKVDLPFPCEIHHCYPRGPLHPQRFRVLSHWGEPAPLRWQREQVLAHHESFDLIVTCDRELAAQLPNAKFMVFGDAWITSLPSSKDFSLSFLWSAGVRAAFDGYAMRAELWALRQQMTVPRRYWYSRTRPPETVSAQDMMYPADTKAMLFDSMFSVIVENVSEVDYFSEKLLDAIQTYTVPVYYGCPNITSYFDIRGMIPFQSGTEFREQVNKLTPADYWSRLPYLHANRERSMAFCNPLQRLQQAIAEGHAASQPVPAGV